MVTDDLLYAPEVALEKYPGMSIRVGLTYYRNLDRLTGTSIPEMSDDVNHVDRGAAECCYPGPDLVVYCTGASDQDRMVGGLPLPTIHRKTI